MMQTTVIALLAVAAAMQTPSQDHSGHPGWDDQREAQSLAENLDNTIKLCSELSIKGGKGNSEPGRREKLSVDRGLLKFLPEVPSGLKALTDRHGSARVGRWFDPHTPILIIAWDKAPVCRIMVMTSPYVAKARPELLKLAQNDNFWKQQGVDETIERGLVRSNLMPDDIATARVRPMLTITYDPKATETGTMLTIAVALVQKEAK